MTLSGSSPRMRGTRLEQAGNIPGFAVHPRACGEHDVVAAHIRNVGGSSPRMRGTLRIGIGFGNLCRFIPAHAGNTLTTSIYLP